MTVSRIGLIFLAFIFAAQPAFATREARPMQLDRRVRTILYQNDEVYKFIGHYRYQSAIEFAPDEKIKTISMGDSTAWMLNPSGNRLFLKPIDQDATTNMTLITDKHTYLFELHAKETDDINDSDMVFILRFIYPENVETVTEVTQNVNPEIQAVSDLMNKPKNQLSPKDQEELSKYNYNYTVSGTDEIAPIRVFDDGEFTFFQFRDKNTDVPAIFMVDAQNNEGIVNFRSRGDYVVVERVASKFTLRLGNKIACVFNESAGPLKPPPAPKFLGIF